MTPTQALASLDSLTWDQLAMLYRTFDERAHAATTSTGRSRAMNTRERVSDAVSRRGLVIRSNRHGNVEIPRRDVVFMVGRPEHFAPIQGA